MRPTVLCQGEALIKKLVALDDWDHIYAIARRELLTKSKKITRISLDLNNKEVHFFITRHSL